MIFGADVFFYKYQQREELRRAVKTKCFALKAVHRELAERYGARATQLSRQAADAC